MSQTASRLNTFLVSLWDSMCRLLPTVQVYLDRFPNLVTVVTKLKNVPRRGLEPPRSNPQPPQDCASTSFATWALLSMLKTDNCCFQHSKLYLILREITKVKKPLTVIFLPVAAKVENRWLIGSLLIFDRLPANFQFFLIL